jgi:GTP-binding protein
MMLGFVDYAIVLKTCAISGRGLKKLFPAIDRVNESFTREIPTNALNKFLLELRQVHLPSKKGKTLKLKYITQLAAQPPTFLIFVNDPRIPDDAYKRFLEKKFREKFDLVGTPILFRFRSGD